MGKFKYLTKRDFENALDVQSACNLSGVVHSFADTMNRLSNEGLDTKQRNGHPICRLYAEQIAYLSGAGMPNHCNSYMRAHDEIEQILKHWDD